MTRTLKNPLRLHQRPWFLCVLAAYAVLELSFNHRLLDQAGALSSGSWTQRLHEMEVWSRVISGLGLGLLLMRWLDKAIRSRTVLVIFSVSVGILVIWHLQKALIETIVARADPADQLMSVQSILSTGEALKGRLELRGLPVLEAPADAAMRPVMGALWASSLLGLHVRDIEATSGAAQLLTPWMSVQPEPEQLREAYRRVVVIPVALGASLLFGMLNIGQLLAGLTGWVMFRLGMTRLHASTRHGLLPIWLAACLAMSWLPGNAWVNSPGYSQAAGPALWQAKPLLAPFVEWSVRAELAWSDPVAWVHREMLGNFDFSLPQGLSKAQER